MLKRSLIIAVLLGSPLSYAHAEQYMAEGGKVVHNRLAPVLLHRAVPPFRGQHVYSRSPRREATRPMERAGKPIEWEGTAAEWHGEALPTPKTGRMRGLTARPEALPFNY